MGQRVTWTLLLWAYVVTATLVIVHEIDSAFWREWELLRLPGGSGGFALIHVPIVAIVLIGAVAVAEHTTAGVVLALAVAAGAIAAGGIHAAFMRAGSPQFRHPVSIAILGAGVVSGLALAACAVAVIVGV